MGRKILVGLAVVGMMFLGGVSVGAANYYVSTAGDDANDGTGPGDANAWLTIQHAIDTVVADDIINVAAGTYNEHLIIHTPNINLIGEDKESTIIDAMQDPSWSSAKAGILIEGSKTDQLGASNVTISGFTIRNAELEGDEILFQGLWECLGGASGIQIYGSSGNTIENNIIEKCGYQIWILAESAGAGYSNSGNNIISQNVIRDSAQRAIYLYSDNSVYVVNTTISNNTISDTRDEFGTSAGIYMWGEVTDTLIENNTITNCNDGIRTWNDPVFYNNSLMNHTSIIGNNITHSRGCGILLQNDSYNTVSDNILEYNGGGGIQIHYGSNSLITGTTIRENPKGGILLTACENTTVTGNNIFDNNGIREIGIIVHSVYGITTGLVVNNNNIYGHTEYGMQVMDGAVSSPVNATNNWWGDTDRSGPGAIATGTGDKVTANVNYDPWIGKDTNTSTDVLPNLPAGDTGTLIPGENEIEVKNDSGVAINVSAVETDTCEQGFTGMGGGLGLDRSLVITSAANTAGDVVAVIKFHYTQAELTALGISAQMLRLYCWDAAQDTWVAVGTVNRGTSFPPDPAVAGDVGKYGVDTTNNFVWAVVDHFSVFGGGLAAPILAGGGGGGCFIATAAFGTSMAKEVKGLCEFRDNVLLKTTAGRDFVELYYKTSPLIADFIRNKPVLKTIVRIGLKPLIWFSRLVK